MKALERRKAPHTGRYSALLCRHAICCQSSLAADYCDFSRAEARKVWRQYAPSGSKGVRSPVALRDYGGGPTRAFFGDLDDAESIGLGALVRSAQIWPPKCPGCGGAGRMLEVITGVTRACGDCAGTGKPRDERNVFHAYLRLAIRTQVLNEIHRRTVEAEAATSHGRRVRHSTGNYRAGRGILRDSAETVQTGLPPSEGVRVWTGRLLPREVRVELRQSREPADEHAWPHSSQTELSRHGVDSAGAQRSHSDAGYDIHDQKHNIRTLDVSPLTGLAFLRPSEKLQHAYPRRSLQPAELWEKYKQAYRAELRRSMQSNAAEWRSLGTGSLALLCDCARPDRCHRTVLAEVLAAGLGGAYEGEMSGCQSTKSS